MMGTHIDSLLKEAAGREPAISSIITALRGGWHVDELTSVMISTVHDKQEVEQEFRRVCAELVSGGIDERDVAGLMTPALHLGLMMRLTSLLQAAVTADIGAAEGESL